MANTDLTYYNTEWSIADRGYANAFQLTRAIAIFQAIVDRNLTKPQICELGSGTGWLTSMLGSVGDTLGVELSDVAVERARQRFPHVRFECADVLKWSHPQEAFDIAVSHEVIEHVAEQQRYVDVAYNILKPGGLFILTTPNASVVQAMHPSQRSNQPREDILTRAQLHSLLRTRFGGVRIRSIIPQGGARGIYRVLRSGRLHQMLGAIRLREMFLSATLKAGLGLHLVAIATKEKF